MKLLASIVLVVAACGDAKAPEDVRPMPTVPTAKSCTLAVKAFVDTDIHAADWDALFAHAVVECSRACDADADDTDTCNVAEHLVERTCNTARGNQHCTKLCADAESTHLRAFMCKHKDDRVAAPTIHRVGDRVMAKWTNGRWYPGTITAVDVSSTKFDILYDDGDRSRALPPSKIRGGAPPAPAGRSTQVAARPSPPTSRNALVEGASCAGPGWRYVCGGRCTDVKEDSANCGSCGHRCDDGYHCDGSGTCRDAAGNL